VKCFLSSADLVILFKFIRKKITKQDGPAQFSAEFLSHKFIRSEVASPVVIKNSRLALKLVSGCLLSIYFFERKQKKGRSIIRRVFARKAAGSSGIQHGTR